VLVPARKPLRTEFEHRFARTPQWSPLNIEKKSAIVREGTDSVPPKGRAMPADTSATDPESSTPAPQLATPTPVAASVPSQPFATEHTLAAPYTAPMPSAAQPYTQPYAHPSPQPQVVFYQKMPGTKKGLGITSMVLGISALVFAWTTIFAFVMLVLAFIFGIASLMRKESPRGFAITGIILGSIAVVLVVLIAVVIASFGAAVMGVTQ